MLKGIRPLALLWCAAVVLVYVYICIDTLFHPFNPGKEQLWAGRFILIGAIAAAAHFLGLRRFLAVGVPALVAAAAAAIIILSGSVIAVLLALAIFTAAVGIGDSLLRLFGLGRGDRPVDGLLIALMLGFAILGFLVAVLGVSGLLAPFVVGAILAIGFFPAARQLREVVVIRPRVNRDPEVKETPAVLAVCGWMMLLNLVWAVAPEVQYDALNYHLPVPAAYAGAGRIVDLLYVHSYLAGLMDSLYAIAFVFDSQGAAEMIPFGLAIVSALCVFSLTARIAGKRAAIWAAALFYTAPVIMWAASTTDVDLAVGTFVVALVLSIVRWHETQQSKWLMVTGLIIGAGIGTKPTFGLIMPAVIGFLAWYVFRRADESILSRVRVVFAMTILALTICAPWYLIRASYTGNPLYPGGNSIFESTRPSYGTAKAFGGNFRIAPTPRVLASFPFLFTYDTDAYSESGVASGGAGPYLLLAIPALWLAFRERSLPLRMIAFVAGSYVLIWTVIFSYARFYIPALPLVIPLAVLAVWRIAKDRSALAAAAFILVLAAQGLIVPVQYWIIPDRIPLRNALGRETDESLLRRALPGFGAVEFVNRAAEPGDTAVGLGFERSRHYLRIPFHSFRGMPELRPVARMKDPEAVAESLRERGYDWLLIDRAEPDNGELYIRQSFAEKYGTLRFSTRNHLVYRLAPPR